MMPDMSDAFGDWTTRLRLQVRRKGVSDFQATEEVVNTLAFDGVLLPLTPQKLQVKPEGQRAWKWWQLVTTENLNLHELVIDPSGREFRVMGKTDWSTANFFEYELRQGPFNE